MTPTVQNNEPYALAFSRNAYDFAEIKIELRRLVRGLVYKDHIYSSTLVIRCYVSSQFEHPYGVKFCLDGGDQLEFDELNAAHKVMTGIAKKLKKLEQELGYVPEGNLPEFARRVLVGTGVRTVFYERKHQQGAVDRNGFNLKDGIFGLPQVDPRDGKDFLSVIGGLVDDTIEKKAKKKESA
ncbi:hypothetical protein AB6809_29550 [Paraburkholderia sp. RCC_158]|uniref:hypothetical protein n=1 Tax=Paraburkholderia sp. RCC_158 TaxID=3239220 RepID=UPI003525DD55